MDESTFGLIPTTARVWAKKGSRPNVKVNHACKRFHVFGARTKKRFVFQFSKKQNQKTYVRFLKTLVKRWPKLLLFTDGAPWHRGKLVDDFCKKHKKTFRVIRFPKYSPNLNPVEQCWKLGKRTLANRLIKTLPAARYHLSKTFKQEKKMPIMFHYLCS